MRGSVVAAVGAGALAVVGAAVFFLRKNTAEAQPVITTPTPATTQYEPSYPLSPTSTFLDTLSNGVLNVISQPRGIRNNNPLNIRWYSANNWNGQTGKDSGGFSIFDRPENGIRAAGKILDSYAKQGATTLGAIVAKWAPAVENNVEAYTAHVESLTGKRRTAKISRSAGDYLPLLRAMILHENGKQPYTDSQILSGINSA